MNFLTEKLWGVELVRQVLSPSVFAPYLKEWLLEQEEIKRLERIEVWKCLTGF